MTANTVDFDASPNNLEPFWTPFTANRQFKKAPRLLVAAKDMHYQSHDGRTILDRAVGLQLRRVRVMGANRIELSGFNDTTRDRLKAYGLFHEIISWKLRMFVPTDANGVVVLARVLDRYPVERIGEREAA